MTVYFVCETGKPSLVKIGHTENLDGRLQSLSRAFVDGIELLCTCEGGTDVERAYQSMFRQDWIEGEWFRSGPLMQRIIDTFSNGEQKRIYGRQRVAEQSGKTALDEDREIANRALHRLLSYFGATSIGLAQEKAYQELVQVNPLWSRRRVRAVHERKASRIDHFDIRDLNDAAERMEARR